MRKLFLIFIFIINSFGSENNYELKLYEKILPSIFKKNLLVYADKKSKEILIYSNVLELTISCIHADILIGKDFENLPQVCEHKPVFSTNYRNFMKNKNSIGAFYWRKGRPQIKFRLDTLRKYDLTLPESLMEFVYE